MTAQELKKRIGDGAHIYCNHTFERSEVLQLLVRLGYRLGPVTKTYILPGGDFKDPVYLYPGLSPYGKHISVWRRPGRDVIEYTDIVSLIDEETDEREDGGEGFMAAFNEVLSLKK